MDMYLNQESLRSLNKLSDRDSGKLHIHKSSKNNTNIETKPYDKEPEPEQSTAEPHGSGGTFSKPPVLP